MKNQQTLFITGASSGIGRSIAQAALENGYNVIGTSRNPETTKDKLEGVRYVALDVSSSESIANCWEEIKEEKIDVLINNAGQSQIGPVEETSMEKYRYLFEVNFFGLIDLTRRVLPQMRERRSGTIINIGSLNGRFAAPYYSAYVATKFAVSGFTQSLRSEMKEFGVTVALVEPNHIASNIVPDFNCSEGAEYFPYADNIRQSVKGSMSEAESSKVIANTVMSAIEKNAPSPIYVSGGNASLLAFAKRFLPDTIAENMIRKAYGLGKKK